MPGSLEHMTRGQYDIAIADLTGQRAVVTGASDGIGLGIAARLARAGAEVIMPVRNTAKGEAAVATIRSRHPQAKLYRFTTLLVGPEPFEMRA